MKREALRSLWVDPFALLCSLVCSSVMLFWAYATIGTLHAGAVGFLVLMPLICYRLGHALLGYAAVPLRSTQSFIVAFLLGGVGGALLLFLVDTTLSLPLRTSSIALALVAWMADWHAWRSTPAAMPQADDEIVVVPQPRWVIALAVAISFVAASFWTQDMRPHTVRAGNDYVVRPWVDIFVHAQIVGQLRDDQSIVKLGDPSLLARPVPFYHYASYILPAAAEAWDGRTDAFDWVAALWIPFGIALTGLAAFALAAEWWGDLAGLVAVAALLLLPDPPTYAVPVNWYSYHWLVVASPGLNYGLASAAAALILVSAGLRTDRARFLVLGLLLLAGSVLLKAQIAIVAFPLASVWIILCKPRWRVGTRVAVLALVGVVGIAGLVFLDRHNLGPTMLPKRGQIIQLGYFAYLTPRFRPGAWMDFVARNADAGIVRQLAAVAVVAFVAPFGLLLAAWPIAAGAAVRRRRYVAFDLVPFIALAIYVYCCFFPGPNKLGNIDEIWHRPFVWLYFLLTVWCTGKLVELLPERAALQRRARLVVAVASVALMLVPAVQGVELEASLTRNGPTWSHTHVPAGFVEAGRFIRTHSAEADVVQDDVQSTYPMLSAYTERRAYLGLAPAYWKQFSASEIALRESERRLAQLRLLQSARSESELQTAAHATGIRWYVARPAERLEWPSDRLSRASFTADGYRVYDLRATGARP